MTRKRYTFHFQRCLKADSRYPVLKYFRVERYFTRPLASLVVRSVLNAPITPNQITVFSFIIGLGGGFFLIQGTREGFILGGVLAQLASVFDCADGMLARLRGTLSAYGAYLDLFLDRVTDLVLFGGLAVGYFRWSGDLRFFFLSLAGIMLYFLQVSLYYLTRIYRGQKGLGEAAEARGLAISLAFVLLVAGYPRLLLTLFIVTTVLNNLIKITNLVRLGVRDRRGQSPDEIAAFRASERSGAPR